jgi:predicted nuclease of predicted toxin-antitoxin system
LPLLQIESVGCLAARRHEASVRRKSLTEARQTVSDLFPGSAHARDVALANASDPNVWRYAGEHGFTIVSKDEDFHHLSFLRGAPPKVIGLNTGNCSTKLVSELLRIRHNQIDA